jgi:cytochrome P450
MSQAGIVQTLPLTPIGATFDFDIFLDRQLLVDPHARIAQLLKSAPPVFWTGCNGGHWTVIRYEEAYRVLRDTETFSSSYFSPREKQAMLARVPADLPRIPELTPVMLDPPEHTQHRAPLQKVFAPLAMLRLKDQMRQLAEELIDAVRPRGNCEFIHAVAEQYPVRIFLKLLGLPVERLAEFRKLAREVTGPRDTDSLTGQMRLRKIADAMKDTITARRAAPRDDLLSYLWEVQIEGRPMTLELMEDYATLLFLGGLDTVVNAIGFAMAHFARNPGLQEQLRSDSKLIPEATEELLRRYSMVIPIRRVTRDTDLDGCQLKEGQRIFVYLPAADLDDREFPAAQTFDLGREKKRHMAFGAGPHRCLGSHLARTELQVFYDVVLQRLPTFELDPARSVAFQTGNILSITSLPLRW